MSVKYWRYALILLVMNSFLWFSFAPGYNKTLLKFSETLGPELTGKPKEVFDKIIASGLSDFQLLIVVSDVVIIVWAVMASQRRERITGIYS